MISKKIPDGPTSQDQQGVPELISGLTDLCVSAPFLHHPPPPAEKTTTKEKVP